MPERKTPQPPRFVPPPPGSTPVVEGPAKSGEVLAKPARPPRTTPTYGVPIIKPEDSTPVMTEQSGETGEIEEADMVAGEIEVRARAREVAAPSASVVVDPTPPVALVEDDADAEPGARKPSGAGMRMALGVGGVAILALVAWKLLPSGGEGSSARAKTAVARSTPAVARPAPRPVAVPSPPPATDEAIGGGTASAATGADHPAGTTSAAMPDEAKMPPPEPETPPPPQEDVQPKAAPPKEKKPKKKKREPKPPRAPESGEDPTPAPSPAPEPAPTKPPPTKPSKAAKREKAKELLGEARKASMRGEYGKAWRLASESYSLSRKVAALQVMGVAACKMGDSAKANKAYRKLPEAKRGSLASVCASNGITLE
jgi:hypothetical protein